MVSALEPASISARPETGVETTVARTLSAQSSSVQVPRVASARSK